MAKTFWDVGVQKNEDETWNLSMGVYYLDYEEVCDLVYALNREQFGSPVKLVYEGVGERGNQEEIDRMLERINQAIEDSGITEYMT